VIAAHCYIPITTRVIPAAITANHSQLIQGDVEVELIDGVAVVRLKKGKVNSIDTALASDLDALVMCRNGGISKL
jgi:hypothetical protein